MRQSVTPRYVAMDEFVSELDSFASRGLPPDEVHAYLAATLIEPATLEPYLRFHDGHYTRNLIHKVELFELLLICWDIGQAAPIHGHEGENCWARVERGRLRFCNYREVSERPLVLEQAGDPIDGGVGHLDGPADIHSVENPDTFGGRAASLHLYSKPFAECDIYDRGEKRRVRLAYDSMFGEPVVAT